MSVAAQYFAAIDVNDRLGLNSPDDLWGWIEDGGTKGLTGPGWPLASGADTFFRGQASAQYGISSKLYRDCVAAAHRAGSSIGEADLSAAERDILDAMGEEGIGRRMTEGEMLMVLQHHGIATRLLDVSASPKEGLFFACDQHGEQDGRFFIFALDPDGADMGVIDALDLGSATKLPWLGAAVGTKYADSTWTTRVAVVTDHALDSRMRAQDGRFLVGGLARRYGGKSRRIGKKYLTADMHTEVCTLDVNFLKSRKNDNSRSWGASGWSIRIPSDWKPDLMDRLANESEPITPDTMYPPIGEVSRLARRVVQQHFKR